MDDVDRRLLALLREDSSRPLKTLAAEVGLSRSSVRDRIHRMHAEGVIRRYTIDTPQDESALNAVLLVRLARTPDPGVVQSVVQRPDVFRCRSLSGPIDLLVDIVGSDVASINATRDQIARLPGVVDVETAFVLKHDKVSA